MSFPKFCTLLLCFTGANSEFMRKCCPENSIFQNTSDCQPSKGPTPVHPLMKPNLTIVYNKSCNLPGYKFFLTVTGNLMVLQEDNSLTVSNFDPIRAFDSTMYCLGYMDGKPGVLICYPEEWLDRDGLVMVFGE